MKLNNKGFALTSIIYMLIVLFLLLLLLILSNLASRKVVLDKLKYDVKNKFGQGGIQAPIGKKVGEIISSEVTTFGDGLYASTIDEGRYIYRGANPNNYIWLDENGNGNKEENELYRIISFESDGTTKVIRDNSIGNMPWDERTSETAGPRKNDNNTYCNYTGTYYGCNAWGNQNSTYLEGNLLQDSFYYKYYSDNITTDLSQNANNKTVTNDSSLNTYLNGDWLNSISIKDYIIEHEYNVGGPMYTSTYIGGDQGIVKEKYLENLSTWKGRVGLFNITEMVESSINSSCLSVYSNYYYNIKYWYGDTEGTAKKQHNKDWPCANENWLFKGITEWSLASLSNSCYDVWAVSNSGFFSKGYASTSFNVRPSFYLKSSLTLSGDGSIGNPYKIVS